MMNYDMSVKNYLVMCCNWIRQAKTHLSRGDSCFIFLNKPPHPILKSFVGQDSRFRFCLREGFREKDFYFSTGNGNNDDGRNFTYKLHIACGLDFPFIFIDADAIIFDSLQELEPLFDEMPTIFIDHEPDIKGSTDKFPLFINSGVFMVNDPSKVVMNWDKILDHALRCGLNPRFKRDGRRISGTDQAVIKSYFDYIRYDYRHEKFGIHYNTCAEGVSIKKNEGGRWTAKNSKGDPVKIVHYWGGFKPWSVGCPIFKELLDDKVFNCDDVLDQTR